MPDPDFHRAAALDDEAASRLIEPRRRLGAAASVLLLATAAIAILALPLWLAGSTPDAQVADNDNDYLPPNANQVHLTPPPAAPVSSPAPASPVSDDGEARRRADEEARQHAEEEARQRSEEQARRRAEAEAKRREQLAALNARKLERFQSPMIVSEVQPSSADPALNPALAPGEAGKDKPKAEATFQDTNPNNQFLAARAGAPVEVSKAERAPRIDALVPQGTMLRGVLETAVNTDLPGMVRAVTTEDTWSFDGRRILVPAGTRLIGEYNAGVQNNQSRAFIVWTRLLRADGVSLSLGSIGTDELGRSGMAGDVDNHYFARYGPVVLISILSGAAAAVGAASNNDRDDDRYVGPIPVTTTDPVTGLPVTTYIYPHGRGGGSNQALAAGAAGIAQNLAQTTGELMKSSMAIQPTITIDQGTPIAIFVRRDLDFSKFYPDPVLQRYRALKRGVRE